MLNRTGSVWGLGLQDAKFLTRDMTMGYTDVCIPILTNVIYGDKPPNTFV